MVWVGFFVCLLFHMHPCHMEVPKLGAESELQLPAYTTATATWDQSRSCDLHCSLRHCQNLHPLSKARDLTHNLMDTSRVRNLLSHNGNSGCFFFFFNSTCEIIQYLSSSVWLISLCIVPLKSIHVVPNSKISSCYGWIIFLMNNFVRHCDSVGFFGGRRKIMLS